MNKVLLAIYLVFFGQAAAVFSQEHYTARLQWPSYSDPPKAQVITFSPDSSELALGTTRGTYFLRTGGADMIGSHRIRAFTAVYSKDGTTLLLIGPGRGQRKWFDTRTKRELPIISRREPGFIGLGLEEKNGKLVVSGFSAGGPIAEQGKIGVGDELVGIGDGVTGKVYSVIGWSKKKVIESLAGNAGTPVALSVIPKGKIDEQIHRLVRAARRIDAGQYVFYQPKKGPLDDRVAWCVTSNRHELTHVKDGRVVASLKMRYVNNTRGTAAVSPDSSLVAFTAPYVNFPTDFKPKRTQTTSSKPKGSGIAASVVGAARDSYAFSSESTKTYGVEIYDVGTGELINTFPIDIGDVPYGRYYVDETAFSADGKGIAVANWMGISVYDIDNGAVLNRYSSGVGSGQGVTSLALSPRYVAVGDVDGGISVVEIESGDAVQRIESREKKNVEAVDISPDEKWVAYYVAGVAHVVGISTDKELAGTQ